MLVIPHGFGGILGTISIAQFDHAGWYDQIFAILVVGIFTVVIPTLIVIITIKLVPIRVDEDSEERDLDLSQHGEKAYDLNS